MDNWEDKLNEILQTVGDGVAFEPDILLQDEWGSRYEQGGGAVAKSGPYRLFLAVLEGVIHGMFTGKRDELLELRSWLLKWDRRDVAVNFQTLCDILGLSSDLTCRRLLPYVEQRLREQGGWRDGDEGNSSVEPLSGFIRKRHRTT